MNNVWSILNKQITTAFGLLEPMAWALSMTKLYDSMLWNDEF